MSKKSKKLKISNSEEENIDRPDWMNSDFFSEILRKNENESIDVTDFDIKIATKKGDNYASVMYRCVVNYKLNIDETTFKRKSLIVKVTPPGDIRTKVMEKSNLYPREIHAYSELLVKVEELLKSINDETQLSPRCIYTTDTPKKLLVFEDLSEQGYQMNDRKKGLDLDESILCLVKLAKLHACSIILHDRDPTIMNMYREGIITPNPSRQDFMIFYKLNARAFTELVNTFDGFDELKKKLKGFEERILPKGYELYTRDDNSLNVLNHDDLWVNNIMFKYNDDGDKLEDLLMFDYQLSYWGSPGIDLNFFLYGSVRDDLREEQFYFLIKKYYDTFADVLKKLDYKGNIPTLQDIHIEIIKTGFHGKHIAITINRCQLLIKFYNYRGHRFDLSSTISIDGKLRISRNGRILEGVEGG